MASVNSVLVTAIPTSVQASLSSAGPIQIMTAKPNSTDLKTTRSWYTALPSDVKSFMGSMQSEVSRLATDTSMVAPTATATENGAVETGAARGVMAVGAGIAGALGVALML